MDEGISGYEDGFEEGLKKARKQELAFLKRLDNIDKATWKIKTHGKQ